MYLIRMCTWTLYRFCLDSCTNILLCKSLHNFTPSSFNFINQHNYTYPKLKCHIYFVSISLFSKINTGDFFFFLLNQHKLLEMRIFLSLQIWLRSIFFHLMWQYDDINVIFTVADLAVFEFVQLFFIANLTAFEWM